MGGRTLDLRRGLWYNTAMEVCDVVIAATRPALRRGARLGLLLLAAVLACSATVRAQSPARPRVLMVTYSGGYQHDVVRRASPDRLSRSEEHTSELQSRLHLVCRLLLEKKTTNLSSPHRTRPG